MNGVGLQEPAIEKKPAGVHGLNLSALAVRERSVTLFFLLAIIIAGAVAYLTLGRAEDPTFTIKVFTVAAAWPGATAQEMQDLVAEPLEKRMQELKYYYHVDTFTRPGLAFLTVRLRDYTPPDQVAEEFYQGRKKIQDETSRLPKGVLTPVLNDEYSDVVFAVYALKARQLPLRLLTREAEVLRQDLLHVAGVKKVNILGERPERIFVEFSYDRIATLGVKAQDIFEALLKQNVVTPAGSIDTNNQQVYIRLDGALDTVDKIRNTPIVESGRTMRLSDIADVRRGYEDPATFLVHHNGEPALMLDVVMQDQFNGLDLGTALEAEQSKLQKALPVGFTFEKVIDQAEVIRNAVDEFQIKFFVALLVVMVVSPESWLASWDCGRGRGSAHAIRHARCDAVRRHQSRPDLAGRPDPGSSITGRRRHHRDRNHGRKNGRGLGQDQGRRLRLEPHRRANAGRHSRDHHRPDADWLRSFPSGRIRQKPLLGRLHCAPDVVDRCRNVYALPGRETVAGHQADRRRLRRHLRDAELQTVPQADCGRGEVQVCGGGDSCGAVRHGGFWHGSSGAAVFPQFGQNRTFDRRYAAARQQH